MSAERPTTHYGAILRLRLLSVDFSSDDTTALVGVPDLDHTPNGANNSVGAAFARASREGLIVKVGYKPSNQPHRKGGVVAVWRGVDKSQGSLL